jgi:hypothetical protein
VRSMPSTSRAWSWSLSQSRRRRRAAPADQPGSSVMRSGAAGPSSSAIQCPARGHRVKGGPTGRRFVQTLDPAPARLDSAPAGKRAWWLNSMVRHRSLAQRTEDPSGNVGYGYGIQLGSLAAGASRNEVATQGRDHDHVVRY